MSSSVMMRAGYETGATFVGHSDFLLGDDARRSSAEHLIATKALRCTAAAWILIAIQCSVIS